MHAKKEASLPDKIITGEITDVNEQGVEYLRLNIYFDIENFNVTNGGVKEDFTIGETVALHYILKQNEKRGSLIRVEKISRK